VEQVERAADAGDPLLHNRSVLGVVPRLRGWNASAATCGRGTTPRTLLFGL
jgi:hypothetical protein